MKIAVYCGSSFGNMKSFSEAAEEVGGWIAERGHTMIYGGSKCGLMGVVADAALKGGASVIGVEPRFFLEQGLDHPGITKTIPTDTMAERKTKMIELSDAYIALPGGPGTLDEISEVFVLAGLDRHSGVCVLYNKEGYYDLLIRFLDQMVSDGFLLEEYRKKLLVAESLRELDEIFETL